MTDDLDDDQLVALLTVERLERLLMILRQTVRQSGGGSNLNVHDKDDQLHFAFEGTMPHGHSS